MRTFKLFTHSLLLATAPSLLIYPQETLPQITLQKVIHEQDVIHPSQRFSYEEVMNLLGQIESGELEKTASLEDLEKINQFLVCLAQEGVLPDGSCDYLAFEHDVTELLHGTDTYCEFVYSLGARSDHVIIPAIFNAAGEVIFCKGWFHKRWDSTKKFIKKHKKEIIIGTIIAVAVVATVVAVVAASSTAATVAGTAGGAVASCDQSPSSHSSDRSSISLNSMSSSSSLPTMNETPMLKGIMEEQIFCFKENLAKEQLFETPSSFNSFSGFSMEETGRMLGPIFAHENAYQLNQLILQYPQLSYEIETLSQHLNYPISKEQNRSPFQMSHLEIDRQFSSNYANLFNNSEKPIDFIPLFYQARGEKALALGCFNQAVCDLGKAIETNPMNPVSYLQRGIAYFELGHYDRSVEDYQQFAMQSSVQESNPHSILPFCQGFSRGLTKGIYESGKGLILFMTDFVKHPVQTSKQITEAISTLVDLVRSDEWGVVAEVLSPEIHQIVTQWDMLPLESRGELAGYAVGKHGADILAPGALAKVASKSAHAAKELAGICKSLQLSQETLLLETAAGIGNTAKIAEVVEAGQKMAFIAEELGITAREMGHLKQAGKLEATVSNKYDHLSLSKQESIIFHKRVQDALKPYIKTPLPEFKVRELIHETGLPTFSRPKGIPDEFLVMIADKSGGMEYVHPTNTHIRVRVMPGKLHSPNPSQQKPYVIQQKNGQAFDKQGNLIQLEKSEAHIPLEEFVYRE